MPLDPPSGYPPPDTVPLPRGERADLEALVLEICRRYRAEFPDEEQRYGPAGFEWCVHDNRYLVAWAAHDVVGLGVDLLKEVSWLARVLRARRFPLERLARDLEIAAEVSDEQLAAKSPKLPQRLREAAEHVRYRLS